jgi:hypothetical protein
MPLLRYFAYVGASLLGLLLIANVAFTPVPLPGTLTSATDLPPVRIHSDRKLPEAVVFDTHSAVSSAPVPMLPAPVTVARAVAPAQPAATVTEISPKARVREAFAQLPDSATSAVTGPKMVSKPPVKRKVVARPRTAYPYPYMVAQQPHFSPFATW